MNKKEKLRIVNINRERERERERERDANKNVETGTIKREKVDGPFFTWVGLCSVDLLLSLSVCVCVCVSHIMITNRALTCSSPVNAYSMISSNRY